MRVGLRAPAPPAVRPTAGPRRANPPPRPRTRHPVPNSHAQGHGWCRWPAIVAGPNTSCGGLEVRLGLSQGAAGACRPSSASACLGRASSAVRSPGTAPRAHTASGRNAARARVSPAWSSETTPSPPGRPQPVRPVRTRVPFDRDARGDRATPRPHRRPSPVIPVAPKTAWCGSDAARGGRFAAPPRVADAEPSGACPCSAASARHVATCAASRGPVRPCGLGATRGAQAGGVRPPPCAPLRGGAPHEAERRCGARAGGAGLAAPLCRSDNPVLSATRHTESIVGQKRRAEIA